MNLSIPASLLPDVLKRRKELQQIKQDLEQSPQSVPIQSLPSKKKNTVTLIIPDKTEPTVDFSKVSTAKDLNTFSVAALKQFCTEHKLSKAGRRSQLVQRVVDYIQKQQKKEQAQTQKSNTVELDMSELGSDGEE